MAHEEFEIYQEIYTLNAYGLSGYFDENIEINSYYGKEKFVKGAKDAIVFFEEFFINYKSNTDKVLIFCRFMNKYGCTPMLDEGFQKFCASHEFFIYMKDGKIIKIDIFTSIDHDMRFYDARSCL